MTETMTRPTADQMSIQTFIEQGYKLYAQQRIVVRDLESEQGLFRVQVADEYKRRMDDLIAEQSDRLRQIDARQKVELNAARDLLAVLGRLRGD